MASTLRWSMYFKRSIPPVSDPSRRALWEGDGYDLPRIQGRYRNVFAPASRRAGRLDGRLSRAGELRKPLHAACERLTWRTCTWYRDHPFAFRGRGGDPAGGDRFHNRGPRYRRAAPPYPV